MAKTPVRFYNGNVHIASVKMYLKLRTPPAVTWNVARKLLLGMLLKTAARTRC